MIIPRINRKCHISKDTLRAVQLADLPDHMDIIFFLDEPTKEDNNDIDYKRGDLGVFFYKQYNEQPLPAYLYFFDGKRWHKYLELIDRR